MIEFRHTVLEGSETSREAYNSIYKSTGILHRDSVYRWLISLLNPQHEHKLLDISCGEGRLTEIANSMGLNAFGMDFAYSAIQKGQMDYPQNNWAVADGEFLPILSETLDYVTHIGSLEHYEHPWQGASEIARVLKPEGRACILLPNIFGLTGNIRYVIKKGDVFDDGQPLQRYATRKYWENLLMDGGLEIIDLVGYEGSMVVFPRLWSDWVWFIQHPLRFIRLILSIFIPINLSNHFVFICKRSTN
jgi:2-polyprenyl-3-methyl-5-hydroxy-6-metoxy-1,4-benzoquinol methylase